MPTLTEDLAGRLAELRAAGLHRDLRKIDGVRGTTIRHGGRDFLNFSSNDYLGLRDHPRLVETASRALREWGTGSGASRLVCGSLAPHHLLEERLAAWKGTAAAIAFPTGYAAAIGTIPALVGSDDIVVIDRLVHACCIDAARLSGARLRVYRHNDPGDLERVLQWADGLGRARRPRVLVVTESVFSMDGDRAPLRALVELKDRHGAWLMVDEAHAGGLLGATRAGLVEAEGLAGRVEVQMGTLGKALGCEGGYIAGSLELVDFLVNRARSFVFSTAPAPSIAAAAAESVELVGTAEGSERAYRAWARASELATALHAAPPGTPPASAILPWIVGPEQTAMDHAAALRAAGLFVPAIRFPTVARGAARLRFTVTANHTADDVARLVAAVNALKANP